MIGKILFYALYGVVVAVAAVVGFLIGLVSMLPVLAVDAVVAVVWVYEVLTHYWFRIHEWLHLRAADVAGVPVNDEGVVADGGESSHVAYSVRPRATPSPAQAVVVGFAPLLLVMLSIPSIALARVLLDLSMWVPLLLSVPFVLSGRYSYPSDSDSRVVLKSVRSYPYSPANLLAVPLAVFFHVLNLPRHVHYRLSYLSDAVWLFSLSFASRPLSSVLTPVVARLDLSSLPLSFITPGVL